MMVQEVRLRPYSLLLAQAVVSARVKMARRAGCLLWLRDADGLWGVGDAAAWPGFGIGEPQLTATLAALPTALAGLPLEALLPRPGRALPPLPLHLAAWPSEVVFALECAAVDLWSQRHAGGLAALWGVPPVASVWTHALVATAFAAQRAVAAGHRALKVKIGAQRVDEEILRIGAMRSAVGPTIALRCDANGAWDRGRAVQVARHLAAFSPAWLEQPVAAADIAGLAAVRREGGVKVAADEAVTGPAALTALLEAEAVDVVVLKPMYVGGLLAAREMAQQAAAAGVAVMVTHALESAVGRMAARHLAGALAGGCGGDPAAEVVHGLGDCMLQDVGQPQVCGASSPACAIAPGAHWGLQMAAGFAA